MSSSIIKELQTSLPQDAQITEIQFEGSELVIYTKSKDFFINGESIIKEIVSKLKKRIELRPDLSITMDPELARKKILEIITEDAGINEIYFEPEMGKVVIECMKPGLVIGKGGELYRKIKSETFWLPKIERAPAIKSDIVSAIRKLLHSEIDYRKKFLNKVGQKVSVRTENEDDWVRLSCLGAFRHIGRSCLLVETPHSNVIMDFGVDVSNDGIPHIDVPEFDINKIDAVIISHAHLDHSGFVPYLYDKGYDGPLYCTPPTRDLMVLLCMDFIDIAQKEGKKIQYSKKAIETMVKHTITLDYGEVSDITQDIRLTFQPSGHLLGAALTHLHIGKGLHNILYTADIKYAPTKLFDPAFTDFKRVETLIIESTYGSAEDKMPTKKETEDELLSIIKTTVERGGKVLIPSFAVGRAQEIMAILGSMDFPYNVWIEGMILDATAIHTAYPEYLSRPLQQDIFHNGRNPFLSPKFKYIAPRERASIIDSTEAGVILATSGMLLGGPAVEYFKALAPDKRNTIIFVGYQAEGTLGRKIQKGWKDIPMNIEGKTKVVNLEMEVKTIRGFSAHSDRQQLLNFIKRMPARPEKIIVNHGEKNKCLELARDIHRFFGVEAEAPKTLDVVRLK